MGQIRSPRCLALRLGQRQVHLRPDDIVRLFKECLQDGLVPAGQQAVEVAHDVVGLIAEKEDLHLVYYAERGVRVSMG